MKKILSSGKAPGTIRSYLICKARNQQQVLLSCTLYGPLRPIMQGLCLVDWGRGIDLNLFPADVEFIGDCRTSGFRCVEMQEDKPWKFQVPLHQRLHLPQVILYYRFSFLWGGGVDFILTKAVSLTAGLVQVDTYGLCVIAHMMLHGSYMEIEKNVSSDGSYYLPKSHFKR